MRKRILIIILVFFALRMNAQVNVSSNAVTVSVLPHYGWLKYQKNKVHSTGNFDAGFGLTFRHQIKNNSKLRIQNSKFSIAIGVNYRKYHGNMDFNGMQDSVQLTTVDEQATPPEQNYFLTQIFNNAEAQTLTCIEPNIRLEYAQTLTSAIDFIGGLGLGYGINIAESNLMKSGSYRRYAWFYENHNLIENLPSMNLGTYTDFLNPLQGKTFTHSLFALCELGFRFKLSSRWQLLTLLNLQCSLLNIQNLQDVFTHHESYSGIAKSEIPQGVRAISAGIEIGLSYQFGKSQKRPRTQGAHCPYWD